MRLVAQPEHRRFCLQSAGLNVKSLGFCQRKELLLEPDKPLGSIRRYGNNVIVRVRFVKSAQQLGFSLLDLTRVESVLKRLVDQCNTSSGEVNCPRITALST